jgi:hypothetical protein
MVQSQRNTVTNGIAERNTGAPFIAHNFPLYSTAAAYKNIALVTHMTDYLMEVDLVTCPTVGLQMVSELGQNIYRTYGSLSEQVYTTGCVQI